MCLEWYALRSKPNKEASLWREVAAQGLEVFYPQIRVQPVNPRSRKIKPYFPGYMFVHLDLLELGFSALRWLPHSHGLVSFGSKPSSVPEELIGALRRRVGAIDAAGGENLDGLKHGDTVGIQGGPFTGYDALFDTRLPGSERVRVLLMALEKRLVPLELPAGHIQQKTRQ